MPRVKSTPVKRQAHRFESALLSNQDDDAEEVLLGDNEDEDDGLGELVETQTSPKQQSNIKSSAPPLDEPNNWLKVDSDYPADGHDAIFEYCCACNVPGENYFFLASVELPVLVGEVGDIDAHCILEVGSSLLIVSYSGFRMVHRYPPDALAYLISALRDETIVITYRVSSIETGCSLELCYYSAAILLSCPGSFLFLLDCESVYSTEGESLNFDANKLLCDIEAKQLKESASSYAITDLAGKLSRLGVLTKLRPYQLEGVGWMFSRLNADFAIVNTMSYMHIIPPPSTVGFHFSAYYGCLLHSSAIASLRSSVGGFILADEMGLGKSLQILSLILLTREQPHVFPFADKQCIVDFVATISLKQQLSRRSTARNRLSPDQLCLCGSSDFRPSDIDWVTCISCKLARHARCSGMCSQDEVDCVKSHFVCIGCQALYYHANPLVCNTALIIMPSTLLNQWQAEVRKHIDPTAGLKIFVWDEDSFSKKDRKLDDYSPRKLASYDVIILSFSVLRHAYHSSNVSWDEYGVKQLKNGIFPPPFLCLHFRMIIVDETQNLEGSSESHALQIACKLHCGHKICVSGTPIGHNSLSDLSSLMQFLKIEPFSSTKRAWKLILTNPKPSIAASVRLQWIADVFNQIMLRRTKQSVFSQLSLPSRVISTRFLAFSQFEQALYDEKLSFIQQQVREEESMSDPDLGSLKHKLELLRKGCCHPQLLDVRLRGQPSSNSVSKPLDHIMVNKVEQARLKCEEIQRDVLLYLHKTAGLLWLKAEWLMHSNPNRLSGIDSRLLLFAYAVYSFTWQYVCKTSSPSAALGLVKVSGREKSKDDSISALIDTIPLVLSVPKTAGRASREDTPIISEKDSNSILISSLSLHSLEDFVRSATSSFNQHLVNEVILPSALTCQMQFSQAKCLTSVNATLDVKKLLSFLQSDLTADSTCLVLLPSNLVLRPQLAHVVGEDFMSCRIFNTLFDLGDRVRTAPTVSTSIQLQLPRCKTWHVAVNMVWGCALMFRRDREGVLYGQIHDCRSRPASELGVEVKCFISMGFQETSFDADGLQKLHLSYNILNTFQSLVAPFENCDGFLPTLMAVESMAANAKVTDIANFMGKIDEILHQVDVNPAVGNKRTIAVTADHTPRKKKRVNIFDEEEVTPSTYTVDTAHSAKTELCSTMIDVVNGIEHMYLDTTLKRKAAAIFKLQATSREIEDIEEQMAAMYDKREWWEDALAELSNDSVFLSALETNILQGELAYRKYQDIREVSGLLYLLGPDFERLSTARQSAIIEILKLQRNPKMKEVANSANCRRCREYFGKTGPVCWHCLCYEDKLHIYRTQIITSSQRQVARLRTVGKPSQELGGVSELFQVEDDVEVRKFDEGILDGAYIMIMKLLKSFVIRYNMSQFVEICKLELKWLELVVREMYEMEAVWNRYLDILKRYDELDQCKLRVQLDMGDGAVIESGVDSYKPIQLDPELDSTYAMLLEADHQLQEAKASLNFYRTQTRHHVSSANATETGTNDAANCDTDDDKCIICMESLIYLDDASSNKEVPSEEMTVVLPCAHRFHHSCAVSWIRPYRRCPLCKQGAKLEDIMTVMRRTGPLALKSDTDNAQLHVQYLDDSSNKDHHIDFYVQAMKEDFNNAHNEVKGRWGVKVDAIVTDVVLLLAHPSQTEQKIIVFSQWHEMLEIVGEALQRNGVRTVMCKNRGKDFQSAGPIEVFRNSVDARVLLLPLALGAEGLDLIVASHVFILEPLLNMQQEMQAVNRIYRIGQTRSAMIHKYAVKGTVEERILSFQRSCYSEEGDDNQQSSSGVSASKGLKRDDGNLTVEDIEGLLGVHDSR